MSAFKRSSDKKHKRLLQDSLLSSTHSSFTQDENVQPEDSMLLTRADSLKPQQLLHTPSPGRSSRKTGFQRAFDDQALQVLDNTGVIDVVIFRLSVCMHVPGFRVCRQLIDFCSLFSHQSFRRLLLRHSRNAIKKSAHQHPSLQERSQPLAGLKDP